MNVIGRAARVALVACAAGATGAAAVLAGNALRRHLPASKKPLAKLGDVHAAPELEDAVEVGPVAEQRPS